MPPETPAPRRRATRLRLYAPFVALALLAFGWTVAWFVIRNRVVAGLDEWMAAEANAGRRWTCADPSAGGYPFRIEIRCSSLSLERPGVAAALGGLLVVSQVYSPSHVIAEAEGPLKVVAGPNAVEATWRRFQASVVTARGSQRLALVAEAPTIRASGPDLPRLDLTARRLETHLRPDPANAGTADWALSAAGATVPGLDALIGGTEPADIELVTAVTQAYDLPARPVWSELDRWRAAGGRLTVTRASLAKGPRRVEAKGAFSIDDLHRPTGQLEASAAGIEGLLGRVIGDRAGLAGNLLGALLGPGPAEIRQGEAAADPKAPRLRPLPPFRVEAGRLFLGPLPVPGVRIPALY